MKKFFSITIAALALTSVATPAIAGCTNCGDNSGGGFSSAAAVAGYPHITVPAGFVSGLPVGISFVGTEWSEPKLIAMAYAFEQATKHRRAPTYLKTVPM